MATATKQTVPESKPMPDIFDRAVCLSVQMGCLGGSKKVSVSQIEVDADKRFVAVSKRLFSSKEYDAVKSCRNEIRRYLASRAVPTEILRGGIYMVNKTVVAEIYSDLEAFQDQLKDLAKQLASAFRDIQRQDEERLRALYNPKDYPSEQEVIESIYLDWQLMSFGTPEDLPRDLFSKEAEKAAQKVEQAAEAMQQLLRAEMAGLVDHMVEKLSGSRDNGKPKIFRDSLVENLRDFLRFFRDRNITDDSELEALTEKAGVLLQGVDPAMLRDDDTLRARVAAGFAEVKATLDTMVTDEPIRKITLED